MKVIDFEGFGGAEVLRFSERPMPECGPEQILILQAGGSGLYSMVMPSWSAGTHFNSAVSVQVEADNFCEIPGLAGS